MKFLVAFLSVCILNFTAISAVAAAPQNPIVFVTQKPFPQDFATINSTFGNQRASLDSAPRGGDLYIRYADGSLRNLTRAAGYGRDGDQSSTGIAVRDPAVSWNGDSLVFSMVIGAPSKRYDYREYRWQLYTMTKFQQGQTPVISKVPSQPIEYNNIMPTFDSNGDIIFVSDRPPFGKEHLYPQRDEYESTPTNTGLWRLTSNGSLAHLDHAPSGDFNPFIDSFGRIIFTRWDHLERDQQVGNEWFKPFNYASEETGSARFNSTTEIFPEPHKADDPDRRPELEPHRFNHFFPWQLNQDGTGLETINHIGRHELHSYIPSTFNDDDNLTEFYGQYNRYNTLPIQHLFHISEDPLNPGKYLGVDAPEFGTHAAGQVVALNGPPDLKAGRMSVEYITHRSTSRTSETPSGGHSGLYRDPIRLTSGDYIASHTTETREDRDEGSTSSPVSRYDFRLRILRKNGSYYEAAEPLTPGIQGTISYWNPDDLVSYSGELWELQPVEIVARPTPTITTSSLPAPESNVLARVGVSVSEITKFLRDNNLALIVSRDVTTRDSLDLQQPFNLRVEGSSKQTTSTSGKIYDISFLQIFQGDLLRGYGGTEDPFPGRRVYPNFMHDGHTANPELSDAPPSTVKLGTDGSMAAFVPAQRALSWHLLDSSGNSVVKERYWLTFAPGEIRVCASCHGVSETDQVGHQEPTNEPLALENLLRHYKGLPPIISTPSPQPTSTPQPEDDVSLSIKLDKNSAKRRASKGDGLNITITAKTLKNSDREATLRVSSERPECSLSRDILLAEGTSNSIKVQVTGSHFGRMIRVQLVKSGTTVQNARVSIPRNSIRRNRNNQGCFKFKSA